MTQVTVVVGGQFGSEGKGAVAGFLGRKMKRNDLAIRVAGPNAGHTAYDAAGQEWKLRAVPVAAVTSEDCQLHIAAGSEVDLEVLWKELRSLDDAGHNASRRLTIHPSATLLEPDRHPSQELERGIVGQLGSTGKGIGAARADRIWRTASTFEQAVMHMGVEGQRHWEPFLGEPGTLDLHGVSHAVIEGTQGYGLGLHTGYYPRVTSSDCRAVDFLAMAGISPWALQVDPIQVIVVARTYPIRVAGNSGPLLRETSWEELGLPQERTTVTNKVRRVGDWDIELLRAAVEANGGGGWNTSVQLAITMLDQRFKGTADTHPDKWQGATAAEATDWLLEVQDDLETDIAYVGTGPQSLHEVTL